MKYLLFVLLFMKTSEELKKTEKSKKTEKPKNPEKKPRKFSKLKSVITSLALIVGAASCDNIPNDQIIANPTSMSVKFNLEYYFFQWSAWTEVVSYDVYVYKVWDLYIWKVKQRNWPVSTTTTFQADNLDNLFKDISKEVDNQQISDETRYNKDVKLDFAKQVFKDSVLNNKNPTKGEIRMKYKK